MRSKQLTPARAIVHNVNYPQNYIFPCSTMKSKTITNYLSPQEIDLIDNFIEKSTKRFQSINRRIRTTPQRLNTYALQKIYIQKHGTWDIAVKKYTPNNSSTYINMIRKSKGLNPCAIDNFLKSLMLIIQQATPPIKQINMLQKLENDLSECEYSCQCPS